MVAFEERTSDTVAAAPGVEPMRVLALVQKPPGLSPGQRFRLEQWAPHLRARHGIDIEFAAFESPELTDVLYQPGRISRKAAAILRDAWRRRSVLSQAHHFDAVILYREAAPFGPAIYERLLHQRGVPLILDFDDAIWIPNVASVNGLFSHLRFSGKTSFLCQIASVVTVGNQYLGDYARRYNNNVYLVPTSIELANYPFFPPLPQSDTFVIGWTGSRPTLTHLELARPVIEELARRRRIVVRVICSEPPANPFVGARMEFVRWTAESEAAELARCHVGIMPLPDDAFARGKCACKALQFMAAGRPIVTSPVGMNAELIQSGHNGVLATTVDEWVTALDRLAEDPAERDRLAAAGRKTIEEGFSAEVAANRFAAAIRSIRGPS